MASLRRLSNLKLFYCYTGPERDPGPPGNDDADLVRRLRQLLGPLEPQHSPSSPQHLRKRHAGPEQLPPPGNVLLGGSPFALIPCADHLRRYGDPDGSGRLHPPIHSTKPQEGARDPRVRRRQDVEQGQH